MKTFTDRDLDVLRRLGDLARDAAHDIGVDPEGSGAERLTRELEQYAATVGGHGASLR